MRAPCAYGLTGPFARDQAQHVAHLVWVGWGTEERKRVGSGIEWDFKTLILEKPGGFKPPASKKARVSDGTTSGNFLFSGNVEKSRQRRSRPFPVLTYKVYAPRVKRAAALLDGLF